MRDVKTQINLSSIEEAKAKQRAARLSILVAAFLIALKAATAWHTGSISVLSSLLDSTMDIFVSVLNFFAVCAASRPPDEDHAYGHGKVESLAGLFQATVILVSGCYLIYEAIRRLTEPRPTEAEWFGVVAMIVALIATIALVTYLRRVARATESIALRSEFVHYASDIFANASALFALLIVAITDWQQADPIVSLVISVFILWLAFAIARESIDVLMDRSLPLDVDEIVARIVNNYAAAGVLGFHNLRSRRSGAEKFIEFHLEVDRRKTFEEAHDLTVNVLRCLEAEIPRARVQIHTDPAGNELEVNGTH
jgi:ferrous-iron efflux pump FieF